MEVQPHLLNLSAYINQNLEKDLPLSSLAKRVGLSPFHFHRKFGAYFGESLHQHIKRLRLERAAYALMNGSTPVRQIARDSGYKTVSAFSHAFSGFAGESPTRYRSQALARREEQAAADDVAPVWIGELPSVHFAFLRAKGRAAEAAEAVRQSLTLLKSIVGTMQSSETPTDDERYAFIVSTSDLYGVIHDREFRLDVGIDAGRVAQERVGALGTQTLPGGLYARFDFRCAPDEVLDRCLSAVKNGLKTSKRTPRLAQYFLRFESAGRTDDAANAPVDYRFFVPLAD